MRTFRRKSTYLNLFNSAVVLDSTAHLRSPRQKRPLYVKFVFLVSFSNYRIKEMLYVIMFFFFIMPYNIKLVQSTKVIYL